MLSLKASSGGGGSFLSELREIHAVSPLVTNDDGSVWLRSGVLVTPASYPDAAAHPALKAFGISSGASVKGVTSMATNGSGTWVAVYGPDSGNNTYSLSTDNGVTWSNPTDSSMGGSTNKIGVVWTGTYFVMAIYASATSIAFYRSATGLAWSWTGTGTLTFTALPTPSGSINLYNYHFVWSAEASLGVLGIVNTASDAIVTVDANGNGTKRTIAATTGGSGVVQVARANGRWIVASGNSTWSVSTDGVTWSTLAGSPALNGSHRLVGIGSLFMLYFAGSSTYTVADGTSGAAFSNAANTRYLSRYGNSGVSAGTATFSLAHPIWTGAELIVPTSKGVASGPINLAYSSNPSAGDNFTFVQCAVNNSDSTGSGTWVIGLSGTRLVGLAANQSTSILSGSFYAPNWHATPDYVGVVNAYNGTTNADAPRYARIK